MNKRRSIFLSAISGNVLEYYDFTVYAVFSLAIGQAFFPSGSQVIQTLSSLSVFAVGFIMRPIGGIIFGFIADPLAGFKFTDILLDFVHSWIYIN